MPGASVARPHAVEDQAAGSRWQITGESTPKTCAVFSMETAGRAGHSSSEWNGMDKLFSEPIRRDVKFVLRLLEDLERTRGVGTRNPSRIVIGVPSGHGGKLNRTPDRKPRQTQFLPLTAANVPGGGVGDSVMRVSDATVHPSPRER